MYLLHVLVCQKTEQHEVNFDPNSPSVTAEGKNIDPERNPQWKHEIIVPIVQSDFRISGHLITYLYTIKRTKQVHSNGIRCK